MPKVTYTSTEGQVSVIDGNVGDSVMETAVRNGVPGIVAECGGQLACATCHVYVREQDQGRLQPMEEMEDEMLYGTESEREDCSRLSCQVKLTEDLNDLHVTTPEAQV